MSDDKSSEVTLSWSRIAVKFTEILLPRLKYQPEVLTSEESYLRTIIQIASQNPTSDAIVSFVQRRTCIHLPHSRLYHCPRAPSLSLSLILSR